MRVAATYDQPDSRNWIISKGGVARLVFKSAFAVKYGSSGHQLSNTVDACPGAKSH